jgi:hypothetical protein
MGECQSQLTKDRHYNKSPFQHLGAKVVGPLNSELHDYTCERRGSLYYIVHL